MEIETLIHGAVREVRLNMPATRNAIGVPEAHELTTQLQAAMDDTTARCIVLSANGPAFCAGGNLKTIAALARQGKEAVRTAVYGTFQDLFRQIESSPIPLIAAVDGPAIGVGADLAFAADLTYAGQQGWFAQGWIKLGLIPATGGIELVQRRTGTSGFWRFLIEDRVDGPAAERMGLAVSVVSALEASMRAAQRLAEIPRAQLTATRELSKIRNMQDHWGRALDYQVEFLTSDQFLKLADRILSR